MNSIITLRYRSCDGYSEKRTFKTLKGAQRYAERMLGGCPELTCTYAVSTDGIGTIYSAGASLSDIFPHAAPPYDVDAEEEAETYVDNRSEEDREYDRMEEEFMGRYYGEAWAY